MSSYVITGAAKGIGFEFVKQLSADSNNAVFAMADITDPKALSLAATEVSKVTGGKLDYLINNAGSTSHSGLTLDQFPSPEALEHDLLDNFKTNTIGVVHTTNAFLPLLKKGSAKKVLCLSSALGDLDLTLSGEVAGQPAYSMSKAAMNMVVAKYAAQYKAHGFVFLAVSPGLVKTSLLPDPDSEDSKMLVQLISKYAPDFKGPIRLRNRSRCSWRF